MSITGFTITDKGSIDLRLGSLVISGIVPYLNEHPIFAFSVEKSEDSVKYETPEAVLTIRVRKSEDEIVLSSHADLKEKAHDIEPFGEAILSGAYSCYYQGFGMEGPSGCEEIEGHDLFSHGIIGLEGGSAVSVFAVDHRRFNTTFRAFEKKDIYGSEKCLSCGINLENTVSGEADLPEIHFLAGEDVVSVMKNAAMKIADEMHARTCLPSAYNWCSWYYYYENMDQAFLDELLEGLRKDPVDLRYIQLDAGYVDHTGDWLRINHRYPEGLGKAAEAIKEAGFKPGIWIAPFMIGDKSETYRDHPDWIIRNKDGSPYIIFRSYTEPKIWGNTDNDYFVLDTTNPEAFGYLKEVFGKLAGEGFELFKIDFLLWCFKDTSEIVRYDMSKTSVEVLRQVLEMIRGTIGEDSFLLASIAPFMPVIGYADGVRLAGDTGAAWSGAYSPENLLKELPFDNYFNNIYWQNDPDSVILRDHATYLSEDETWSLALLQAVSGGMITTSDPVHELPENRRKLLEFIKPGDDKAHAVMPYLTRSDDTIVIANKLHDWNLLYVLNTAEHPVSISLDLSEIFGTEALFQYRYDRNDDNVVSENSSHFSGSLASHSSVLLFITEEPMSEKPSNLWHQI